MRLKLRIWRQRDANDKGKLVDYDVDVNPHMSFLEMLDELNGALLEKGEEPVAFDHDCREGICGTCNLYINGRPHGPIRTTTCQLHMRHFHEGETVVIEPWRAKSFPIVKDLVVDRSAFDRIVQAGGYISVNTGSARDANEIPIPKPIADEAFNSAACIACGACVAQCKNASAALFTSAKIAQLALLPQGQPERARRVQRMVWQMDAEGFGNCSNEGECEAVCPKEISIKHIALMNREYVKAARSRE